MAKTYTNPGPVEFDAPIKRNEGGGSFVDFPFDLKELYGTGNLVPVKITFDATIVYQGRLAKMGGDCAMVLILKEIREKLGKDKGDTIHVKVELDDKPRELVMPVDIGIALDAARLLKTFEALAYSHRREYLEWVTSAKKLETRLNRIQKMCTMLKEGTKSPR